MHHETKTWLEVTTLLIPGYNDSEAEITRLAEWFAANLGTAVPLHFTAFHPDYRLTDVERTPHTTLLAARAIAQKAGLQHVYVGNVHDEAAGSTYCTGCGIKLIGRDWYQLGTWNLTADGHCSPCGTLCAGVFDGPAGTWGAKRQRVDMTKVSAALAERAAKARAAPSRSS